MLFFVLPFSLALPFLPSLPVPPTSVHILCPHPLSTSSVHIPPSSTSVHIPPSQGSPWASTIPQHKRGSSLLCLVSLWCPWVGFMLHSVQLPVSVDQAKPVDQPTLVPGVQAKPVPFAGQASPSRQLECNQRQGQNQMATAMWQCRLLWQ